MEIHNGEAPFQGEEAPPLARKKPESKDFECFEMLTSILAIVKDDVLPDGTIPMLLLKYGWSKSTLGRLWKRSIASSAQGRALACDYCSHKKIVDQRVSIQLMS